MLWHVPNVWTVWKELGYWHKGYSNNHTLFLGGNHYSENYTIDITNRLSNLICMYIFFSSQKHGQAFSQTWVLVVSLLLILSVFCVFFIFDLCIGCPMLPVSMDCPFCYFLCFFINYICEWVIVAHRQISNFNIYNCENKLHSKQWYWCSLYVLYQHG